MRPSAPTSRQKVRKHRDKLRALGLRPVQVWVPDVRARSFAAAARKQSRLVAAGADAAADQAFIDTIGDDLAR